MQTNDIIVTMAHVREAQLCSRGARQWFSVYKLDYNKFLAEGLPVGVIEGTGDAFGMQVGKIAREAHEEGGL